MELWGITGPMGAGKSSAMAYLKKRGFAVIDADEVSREVVDPAGAEGFQNVQKLAALFGEGILTADGRALDRRKLRQLMAGDPAVRARLEAFMHPLILDALKKWATARAAEGASLCFMEGSRLVESGYAKNLSGCVLVTAPEESRLKRVMARDGMSRDDTLKRFARQNERMMRAGCGVVWENSGDPKELTRQIDEFLGAHGG